VLVTGVGAIIGYGAVRSLRAGRHPVRIIGMDIYADAVGQNWCDSFVQALPAAHSDYVEFLVDLLEREQVDLVLPAIEQDLARMVQEEALLGASRARLALNDRSLVRLADDKWKVHELVQAAGIPVIPTSVDGQFDQLAERFGSPFLLKPRRGYASKGIVQVSDEPSFRYWRDAMGEEFMAQKIVGVDDRDEYTVGAFGLGDGTSAGCIVLQRTLSGEGATAKAWVRRLPELEALVQRLVGMLRPQGPTNFQFRRHEDAYLLLEINPRLSSSNSVRTAFGYNEAEMCIDYYLLGLRPDVPIVRDGFVVRYIEDLVAFDRDHF
jgi:carbamoyl-phosphate synthase large subunit